MYKRVTYMDFLDSTIIINIFFTSYIRLLFLLHQKFHYFALPKKLQVNQRNTQKLNVVRRL